ncbi:hypothetical protein IDH44_23055 [Paenibacillus sp. IB182496]|uniref:Uncharacterized protein n=1 Tax=Paenibacillus sabuli TaxID=2772509 RepID=A0A927GU83_9BACL|nr:hypothetical protein [Paenibacillus sabuli]MBD2848086.1 hypothetical protein [Paenibacillus sabuli]
MKAGTKEAVRRIIGQQDADRVFEAYLERSRAGMHRHMMRKAKGHTRAVAAFDGVHEGRATAAYYAAASYLGRMDEAEGLALLRELALLQVVEVGHPQRGGFRWYREETEIDDTNAAFFILMPLAALALSAPEAIPAAHDAELRRMFGAAIDWFAHECAHPKLFYPNKTVSDGALLLALSTLVRDEEGLAGAARYFVRWLDYTERRGWGWGENTSTGYGKVMLDAFQLALLAWDGREPELAGQLRARRDELLELARFHGGREYVPSIRGYNFEGQIMKPSLTNLYAGVRCWELEVTGHIEGFVLSLLLYEALLPQAEPDEPIMSADPTRLLPAAAQLPVPRTRRVRIFDDVYACTWIGANGRLGTVSRFPAMPGSYHWPTWGLGWQSMPVSWLAEDGQLSFLRLRATQDGRERTHPADGYHGAYLSPGLLAGDGLPEPETACVQRGPVAIVHRSIAHLAHSVSELADEWLIPRYAGAVRQVPARLKTAWTETAIPTHAVPRSIETEGGAWTVLDFPRCCVAVLGLSYIACGEERAQLTAIETTRQEDGALRLTRHWYRGEARLHRQHRVDHAWVVVMLDDRPDPAELAARLERIEVSDRRTTDGELPRSDPFMLREIAVRESGEEALLLRIDPYDACGHRYCGS